MVVKFYCTEQEVDKMTEASDSTPNAFIAQAVREYLQSLGLL